MKAVDLPKEHLVRLDVSVAEMPTSTIPAILTLDEEEWERVKIRALPHVLGPGIGYGQEVGPFHVRFEVIS